MRYKYLGHKMDLNKSKASADIHIDNSFSIIPGENEKKMVHFENVEASISDDDMSSIELDRPQVTEMTVVIHQERLQSARSNTPKVTVRSNR
jgi:hypothetical protein